MSLPERAPGESNREILPVEFEANLLNFINDVLPRYDRRGRTWEPVSSSTLLFSTGLLDSLSILHLIAAIEGFTGNRIPDHLVVMKHFQSVQAMVETFSPNHSNTV